MKLHAFIFERALIILLEIGSDGDRFVRIGIPFERTQVVWHLFWCVNIGTLIAKLVRLFILGKFSPL